MTNLPNGLTGAVHHHFRTVYQFPMNMRPLINDNTCGSCVMGPHLLSLHCQTAPPCDEKLKAVLASAVEIVTSTQLKEGYLQGGDTIDVLFVYCKQVYATCFDLYLVHHQLSSMN
jgi:hypothetical protein